MTAHVFLGIPGSGKTQLMVDMVSAQSRQQLFFVTDVTSDWGFQNNPRWRNKVPQGLLVIGPESYAEFNAGVEPEPKRPSTESHEDFGRRHLNASVQAVEEFIADKRVGVIVFQHPWKPWSVAQYAKNIGDCVFVSDELDVVATYKGWLRNPLNDFVNRGRHLPNREGTMGRMHLYGAARLPQALHTQVTQLADGMFIFRMAGASTVKRLVDDAVLTPALAEEVTTLADFNYIRYENTGHYFRGNITNPFGNAPKR